MLFAFEILSAILVLVSLYEYFNGMVLDIAFLGVLARGRHSRGRLLILLLAKLVLWIAASDVVLLLLMLETGDVAKASLRQTFLVLFVILIVPLMLLRKPYAKWVARTSHVHGKPE